MELLFLMKTSNESLGFLSTEWIAEKKENERERPKLPAGDR
jgi:hypothetical protein